MNGRRAILLGSVLVGACALRASSPQPSGHQAALAEVERCTATTGPAQCSTEIETCTRLVDSARCWRAAWAGTESRKPNNLVREASAISDGYADCAVDADCVAASMFRDARKHAYCSVAVSRHRLTEYYAAIEKRFGRDQSESEWVVSCYDAQPICSRSRCQFPDRGTPLQVPR